jgi:PEP-CTERM motif
MRVRSLALCLLATAPVLFVPAFASADPFSFSTGGPDGRIALASRPDANGLIEIESADDFILGVSTRLNSASFTGLLPTGASLSDVKSVTLEIYRVFPKDSDASRADPVTGETAKVPTRTNSPSDVEFEDRSTSDGNMSVSTTLLNSSFTAANSILNGINPKPNQATGGEGAVTGQEVRFDLNFTSPLDLPADHYFFVPQVELASGTFFWLSAAGPAVFAGDLQAWIRNANLDPDWLRAGTDIVGGGANAPRFNASFALTGETVPEPATLTLLGTGLLGGAFRLRRRQRA